MTDAELTAAYEADLHARGQKTVAEVRDAAAVGKIAAAIWSSTGWPDTRCVEVARAALKAAREG